MLTTIERVQNYRWQKIDHAHRGRNIPLTEGRNLVYDGRLTPRQRRRVIKKLLRQTKVKLISNLREEAHWSGVLADQIDEAIDYGVAAGLIVETSDVEIGEKLLRLVGEEDGCPTCFATGDSPCVTKSGNPAKKSHANRPALAGKE